MALESTASNGGLGGDGKGPSNIEILLGGLLALVKSQDTFQPKQCDGTDIGPLQSVLKTVVLNKQEAKICNVSELATAIANAINNGSATSYNKPDCIVINPEQSITIAANTVHSLSYKIAGGDGSLQIATGAVIPITSEEADGWQATTTLSQAFTFTAINGTIKLIITKA